MKPWKVILAAVLIFAAGAMAGTSLTRRAPRAATNSRPMGTNQVSPPTAAPNFVVQRLEFLRQAERQLDLTPEQRAKVEQIMTDSRQRTRLVMEKLTPELRDELKRTTQAIRETLTGKEQREKFDRLMRNRAQQQMQKRDEKRPPNEERKKKMSSTNNQAFGQPGE